MMFYKVIFLGLACLCSGVNISTAGCTRKILYEKVSPAFQKAYAFLQRNPQKTKAALGVFALSAAGICWYRWRKEKPLSIVAPPKDEDRVEDLDALTAHPVLPQLSNQSFIKKVDDQIQKYWEESNFTKHIVSKHFSITVGGRIWLHYEPSVDKPAHHQKRAIVYNLAESVKDDLFYEVVYSFKHQGDQGLALLPSQLEQAEHFKDFKFEPAQLNKLKQEMYLSELYVTMQGSEIKKTLIAFGNQLNERKDQVFSVALEARTYWSTNELATLMLIPVGFFEGEQRIDENKQPAPVTLLPGTVDPTLAVSAGGKDTRGLRLGTAMPSIPKKPKSLITHSGPTDTSANYEKKVQEDKLNVLRNDTNYDVRITLEISPEFQQQCQNILGDLVPHFSWNESWNPIPLPLSLIVTKNNLSRQNVMDLVRDLQIQGKAGAAGKMVSTGATGGRSKINLNGKKFEIRLSSENIAITLCSFEIRQNAPGNFKDNFAKAFSALPQSPINILFVITSPSQPQFRIEDKKPLRMIAAQDDKKPRT